MAQIQGRIRIIAQRVRAGLKATFGQPLKASGKPLGARHKRHPLLEVVGGFDLDQEAFYARPAGKDGVFVAIFPWKRKPKCTIVIGVLSPGAPEESERAARAVHERVVREMVEFVVPQTQGDTLDKARYIPEYDWVVTDHYAGPDRRAKPTGFANSFLVFGKRKILPGGLEAAGGFVDRFQPWVLFAFATYVLFSSIDTVLTWVLVGSGKVREVNPILRPLVGIYPVAFILVKNAFSLTSFFLVARLQLFLSGKLLVAINVLIYVVLDLYWASLILRLLRQMP